MPVELGLALYRSHIAKGRHRIFAFETKSYRAQMSTSDINGIDPQIHGGTPTGVMAGLRNIFRQTGNVTTVPEMLASYRSLKRKVQGRGFVYARRYRLSQSGIGPDSHRH